MTSALLVRRGDQRGHTNIDWLDSWHSFSFGEYYEPAQMGFRSLRVINEDRVAGGGGFPPHGHRDMKIISYVIEGKLKHKDSMNPDHAGVLRPGQMQWMSAGRGVRHSEANASQANPVHFFQIWIMPDEQGLEPSYKTLDIDASRIQNRFHTVASPRSDAADQIPIRQDVRIDIASLDRAATTDWSTTSGRSGYLQVLTGEVAVDGQLLQAGDAVAWTGNRKVEVAAIAPSQMMGFDLA